MIRTQGQQQKSDKETGATTQKLMSPGMPGGMGADQFDRRITEHAKEWINMLQRPNLANSINLFLFLLSTAANSSKRLKYPK